MKRIFSLILAFTIMISLCGCGGSFGSVNLCDSIPIPDDGLIQERILEQIQKENAIAVFTGESNGLHYEWTIFGSDIAEPKEINLTVELSKGSDGSIQSCFAHSEPFGFSALLSIYLDESWDAQSATGYVDEQAVASVSLTGSKTTILNMTLDGSHAELVIRPDVLPVEETTVPEPEETTEPTESKDNYLSDVTDSGSQVYTDGKDKYLTDPIPEGKPKPVEPEDQDVDKGQTYTCTFSIECSTILNNLDQINVKLFF